MQLDGRITLHMSNILYTHGLYQTVMGTPMEEQKAHGLTEKLRAHFKDTNTFFESLPGGWSPSVVVLDGMFLINTNPLRQTNNVTSYANVLFNRFIKAHYHKGASTVHLIFDNPSRLRFNTKEFEQKQRDDRQGKQSSTKSKPHEHSGVARNLELVGHYSPSWAEPNLHAEKREVG